jgi:hypothetical protein
MDRAKSTKNSTIAKTLQFGFMLLLTLLPGLLVSGQVKFTTVVSSQEVGRGDYLQIEYVVENASQIDQLNPPDFPGFTVVQGPMQSSGMSVINGNTSQYKGLSFVLQPVKTGKFTIQGASAVVDGKKMRSNPVTITVTATSSGNSNNNNNAPINPFSQPGWPDPSAANPLDIDREYYLRPGENSKDKVRKNLFVKVQVDKTTCYVGEPIVATYKLYSRLNSESRVTRRPSLNGFSVYDMIDPGSDAASVEKLNGKPFIVHIIRKTQLIPLQAGTVDLDPVEVENIVHFIKGSARQQSRSSGDPLKDLFDQMSDDNATGPEVEENVTLDTKPVAITVKPLPEEDKPVNFNGAVGNFSMHAALANKTVGAQDEATLRLVVKGSGNLPVITAPVIKWPSGIDAYDPTAHEDINKAVVPMKGSKTFDYIFSPRTAGHYIIPPIAFSYFDPSDRAYKKIESDPLDLQVTPSSRKPRAPSPPAIVSAAPSALEKVKGFIQQHLESIFAILILSAIAFYLWRQNIRLKQTEPEKEAAKAIPETAVPDRHRQAIPPVSSYPRSALTAEIPEVDPLLEVKQRFENADYTGFYRELNRAVWKAVSDRVDLPASELNKSNIAKQLEARGWDRDTTRSLESMLNECEMNLYTPAYDTYNMQQLLRQAESLLSVLVPHSPY